MSELLIPFNTLKFRNYQLLVTCCCRMHDVTVSCWSVLYLRDVITQVSGVQHHCLTSACHQLACYLCVCSLLCGCQANFNTSLHIIIIISRII